MLSLQELQEVIFLYYNRIYGYEGHGYCGWVFRIELNSYYKENILKVYLKGKNKNDYVLTFKTKAETLSEVINNTIKYFSIK